MNSKNEPALFIGLAIILSAPVVMANIMYLDDYARYVYGYYGWNSDGRPLATLVFMILSQGGVVKDLYPLTQMLAYAIVGYGCYILINYMNVSLKSGMAMMAVVIFNPFILENMLFRYDSITMAIAIFLCLYAYSVRVMDSKFSIVIQSVMVCCALSLYQASVNVFILCAILASAKKVIDSESYKGAFFLLLKSAISFVAAFIFYKLIINSFFEISNYSKEHSQIISINHKGIARATETAQACISLLFGSFNKFYLLAASLCVAVSITKIAVKKRSYGARFLACGVILCLFIIAIIMTFGLVALTNRPAIYPRSFPAFGVLVVFALYVVYKSNFKYLFVIVASACIIPVFSVSIQTLNAVKDQTQRNMKLAQDVSQVLKPYSGELSNVVVVGQPAYTRIMQSTKKSAPLVSKFPVNYFNGSYQFAPLLLKANGLNVNQPSELERKRALVRKSEWKKISSLDGVNIYIYHSSTVLEFI